MKLGNGTSILIFAGIASALPTSVGQALTMAADQGDNASLVVYFAAVFLTTLGIVYVQEAERKIPINYASRYKAGSLARQSYLPFKVLCRCTLWCCLWLTCRATMSLIIATGECNGRDASHLFHIPAGGPSRARSLHGQPRHPSRSSAVDQPCRAVLLAGTI